MAQPARAWSGENYWLMFYQVDGLTVTGTGGVLDGRGQSWWSDKCRDFVSPLNRSCNNLKTSGFCIDLDVLNYFVYLDLRKKYILVNEYALSL